MRFYLCRLFGSCRFDVSVRHVLAAAVATLAAMSVTQAATITFSGMSSDGHSVSATAEFTLNPSADTVLMKLTNATTSTSDAGELFTGVDFAIGGLTPAITSNSGKQRTVDSAGAFADTLTAQNLSWSLAALGGGDFQLNFNPNAEDGIIGPPTSGNYSGANGSIKGNTGHNPFAAEVAEFLLSVPGLEADTSIRVFTFRFGTGLDPGDGIIQQEIPEPATGALAVMIIAVAVSGFLRRGH